MSSKLLLIKSFPLLKKIIEVSTLFSQLTVVKSDVGLEFKLILPLACIKSSLIFNSISSEFSLVMSVNPSDRLEVLVSRGNNLTSVVSPSLSDLLGDESLLSGNFDGNESLLSSKLPLCIS